MSGPAEPMLAAALEDCVIIYVDAMKAEADSARGFSAFDALVAEMESSPESAAQLSEGRRWVGSTFYSDKVTLASLRLAKGLSQKQFGHLAGLAQSHVSRYESGRHEPSISTAQKMATALGVTLEAFVDAWQETRVGAAKSEA